MTFLAAACQLQTCSPDILKRSANCASIAFLCFNVMLMLQINKLLNAGGDIFALVPVGPEKDLGTIVDYVHYLYNQVCNVILAPSLVTDNAWGRAMHFTVNYHFKIYIMNKTVEGGVELRI